MTERADTFIAAQFQEEIDSRIVEALVRVLERNGPYADLLVQTLVNSTRFRIGMQNAMGSIGFNQYQRW